MSMAQVKSRSCFIGRLACWAVIGALVAGKGVAAKGHVDIYSDVRITFAGQTYEFSGVQQSFNESQDGGRVVFNLRVLGTPSFDPLPSFDPSGLPEDGNHWDVISRAGGHSYSFSGTCASQTFSTVDANGVNVRHLYLNCADLQTYAD